MDNVNKSEAFHEIYELNGMPMYKWYELIKRDMEDSKMNRITMAKKLYDKVRVYTDEYTSAQLWRKYALMTDEELAEEYKKEFEEESVE